MDLESKNVMEKDFDIFSLRPRAVPKESFSPEETNREEPTGQ